jgi:hypothetical protein
MRASTRSAPQACLLLSILIVFSLVEFTSLNPLNATSPVVFSRTPSDDTYIDPWNNGTAWGLSSILNATTDSTNRTTMIFLKFDLSGLPSNTLVRVINITLTLTLTSSPLQKADTLAVYGESNNTWAENTLKYPAAPFRNISSIPNDPKTVVSGSTIWNITNLVEPQLGIKNATSLVLHHYGPTPTSTTMLLFSSKEGNPPPTLVVTYRKNPSSITTLLIPGQSIFGYPVIINATLNPAMQTGTIAIQFSTDNLTWSNIQSQAPGSNGTVIALWFPPVATTFSIRSTWSGDSFTQNAISPVKVLNVAKAPTTTSLILSASEIGFGNQTLVIANIRPQLSEGVMLIEYSATFGADWSQLFSGAPTNGIAFQSFIPTITGTYLFRARWLGDANYVASSSPDTPLTVLKGGTTLSLSVSPIAVPVGSTAVISGLLRASGGGALSEKTVVLQIGKTPTSSSGTTIFSNLTALTTDIDGTFAYPWVADTNGTYTLRASFGGNSNYDSSTSRLQVVSVGVQLFPTASQAGLISGFIGFFIGLGVSFLVRFRRQVTVKRRQRYGGTKTKGEQSQR